MADDGVRIGVPQEMYGRKIDKKLTKKRDSPSSQKLRFDSLTCEALLSVQNEKSRTELGTQMARFRTQDLLSSRLRPGVFIGIQ